MCSPDLSQQPSREKVLSILEGGIAKWQQIVNDQEASEEQQAEATVTEKLKSDMARLGLGDLTQFVK